MFFILSDPESLSRRSGRGFGLADGRFRRLGYDDRGRLAVTLLSFPMKRNRGG
jgi:hypothetical protein